MTQSSLNSKISAGQLPPGTREHLTSPVTKAALRIQNSIAAASREYLTGNGFMEMMPPLIGPVTDPGCRGAKQVDVDYYGHKYKVMTSVILGREQTDHEADQRQHRHTAHDDQPPTPRPAFLARWSRRTTCSAAGGSASSAFLDGSASTASSGTNSTGI